MSTIQVKPNPTLDPKAWPLLKHPASGSLLDAAGNVPDDGRPWLYDGFTCRMLTDGAIVREGDPAFETPAEDAEDSDPPTPPDASRRLPALPATSPPTPPPATPPATKPAAAS